jgi:hypothetical protein
MKATTEITLEPVDRRNYRKLFSMQLRPEQITFVTPPRWTLARCYVRQFGDGFEHLPQLIVASDNTNAAALYKSMGFEPTGEVDSEFGEPNYALTDAALEKFRA